ncbi:type 4a pilus biogenesis protein PilO [Rhodoglobus aureus]|uniref:Pilus assembly protein PilO n=1 Tax=Rhodoglobus aureus TaxID=191497 RepID=A0ABP4G128_9MICO
MNNRLWMIIAGVIGVAIFALGWFIGVAPKIDEMNAAGEQRTAVETQNQLHEARLAQLKEEFEQLDSFKLELKSAQALLPPGDELSSFLGELHRLEASSGVVLTEFGAGDGQAYIAAPSSGTTNPLVTDQNFIAIPINLSVTGSRAQVIEFLSDLQFGTRLFLVTTLTVAEDDQVSEDGQESESYNGDISGLVYVLVDPSAPPPSPTPAEPVDAEPAP